MAQQHWDIVPAAVDESRKARTYSRPKSEPRDSILVRYVSVVDTQSAAVASQQWNEMADDLEDLVRIVITTAWQAHHQRPVQTTRIVRIPDVAVCVPDVNFTDRSLVSASKKLGKTVKKSEYEGKECLHAA